MYVLADLALRASAIYTAASYIPGLSSLTRRQRFALGTGFAPLSWMAFPRINYGLPSFLSSALEPYVSDAMSYVFPYEDIWSNLAHSATNYAPALAIIGFETAFLREAMETKRRLDVYGVKSNFAYGASYLSMGACAVPMATACILPFAPAIGIATISFVAYLFSDWTATLNIRAAKEARAKNLDRD